MSLNLSTTTSKPAQATANHSGSPLELWQLFTTQNPVFCCFLFWASILVMKMLLMSFLTALQRFRNKILGLCPLCCLQKVFPNQEDLFFKNIEVQFNDPHVERVRRAHRNDMENILPFFTMALIYISTNPNPNIACNLFRVVAVARIIHTLVYAVYPVPQPTRFLAFFICVLATIYMALDVAVQMMRYI